METMNDDDGDGLSSNIDDVVFLQTGEEAMSYERSVLEECRRRLPGYMVPSRVLCMSRMPLNANGKTDRQELLRLWSEMQMQMQFKDNDEDLDVGEALTMEESRVRDVWAKALGECSPERISVEASLFSIGGHSLTAAHIAHQLGVSIADVYAHDTIRGLTIRIMTMEG
jgi:hypothetical protein